MKVKIRVKDENTEEENDYKKPKNKLKKRKFPCPP